MEYRKQTSATVADPIAERSGWESGNTRSLKGQFDVKEGYVEAAVPLARDQV